jgi:DNA-binding transcriptional regulator YdaS (Cro superfamily)
MKRKRTKKNDKYNVISIEKAIEIIGGAEKLARKIEVSYQTVLNWKNGFSVPNSLNCAKIEKVTDGAVKREDILPDYPWEELK